MGGLKDDIKLLKVKDGWEFVFSVDGKPTNFGTFRKKQAAVKAHAMFALKLIGPGASLSQPLHNLAHHKRFVDGQSTKELLAMLVDGSYAWKFAAFIKAPPPRLDFQCIFKKIYSNDDKETITITNSFFNHLFPWGCGKKGTKTSYTDEEGKTWKFTAFEGIYLDGGVWSRFCASKSLLEGDEIRFCEFRGQQYIRIHRGGQFAADNSE